MTKSELYQKIEKLASAFNISVLDRIKFNPFQFATQITSLEIIKLDFGPNKIFAMLMKDRHSTMILNKARNRNTLSFDCMHELIHFFWHNKSIYKCQIKNNEISASNYYEWEANEGAAEFLVPYKVFIPKLLDESRSNGNYEYLVKALSTFFQVNPSVIKNRIKSLSYEIYQAQSNIQIDAIQLVSIHSQKEQGIKYPNPIGALCPHCNHKRFANMTYCHICGERNHEDKIIEGISMQYKQFETNDGYQLKKCLICDNDDIEQDEKYCKICGHALINYCSNYDEYHNLDTCGKRLSPNARFCPDCGSHSDFYNAGLLQYWEDEKNGLEFTPKIPNTRIKDTAESSVSDATFDKDELPF